MTGATQGYEFFDHTADCGIRVNAPTLRGIFSYAADALMALLIDGRPADAGDVQRVELEAPDAARLLARWLKELLFRFETDRLLVSQVDFTQLTEQRLSATLRGERFNPERHNQGREVKAITHHLLEVQRTEGGWRAQVIVDV